MESKNKKTLKKNAKPPIIKQTKTSLFRTLKANPLLIANPQRYQNIDISLEQIKIPKKFAESLPISSDICCQINDESTDSVTRTLQDRHLNQPMNQQGDWNASGRPSYGYHPPGPAWRGNSRFLNPGNSSMTWNNHSAQYGRKSNNFQGGSFQTRPPLQLQNFPSAQSRRNSSQNFPQNNYQDNRCYNSNTRPAYNPHTYQELRNEGKYHSPNKFNHNKHPQWNKNVHNKPSNFNGRPSQGNHQNFNKKATTHFNNSQKSTLNKANSQGTYTQELEKQINEPTKSVDRSNKSEKVDDNECVIEDHTNANNYHETTDQEEQIINKDEVVHETKVPDVLVEETALNPTIPSPQPQPQILRRSLSAEKFDKKRLGIEDEISEKDGMSVSLQHLSENYGEDCDNSDTKYVFKTPTAYKRRSTVIHTPVTGIKELFPQSISTPSADLCLKEWAEKQGESIETFKSLAILDDENKENLEHDPKSSSFEGPEANDEESSESKMDSKAMLKDLYKLISEGYPLEKCGVWLGKIREKDRTCIEDPLYWECKATIERDMGNFSTAVECYKTAIVKGAEVNAVDQSLEHLLEKFNLLNIQTVESNEDHKQKREKVILDARQIFKSSIIQFAVKERTSRKKDAFGETDEKQFIATPVRRTTRKSISGFVSTPGVKLCSSLNEIDENVREHMSFKGNELL